MTRPDLVTKKLGSLRDQVLRLKDRRGADASEFARSRDLQDATAMSFVVATQEAIDIALHVVSEEVLGTPGTYAESFRLLAHNKIVLADLAQRLSDLVRVRNRIVHGYATVDQQRFWNELPLGIATLEEFAASIAAWLPRA